MSMQTETQSEHSIQVEDDTYTYSTEDLPDEILLQIFNYINKEELITTIPLVCSRWQDVHSDASLYKHLTFSTYDYPRAIALKLLHMATCLKSLEIVGRPDSDEICHRLGPQHCLLETLVLRTCQGTPKMMMSSHSTMSAFQNVLEQCKHIKRLSFKGTYCPNRNFFNDIGTNLSMLRNIDFGNTFFVSEKTYDNIINNSLIHLEEIRARHSQITDEVLNAICLRFSDSLKVVKIFCFRSSDASLLSLASCKNLQKLCLERAIHLTDHGLMTIGNFRHLTHLTISESYAVTSNGWIHFLSTPSLKTIRKLNLSLCANFDDEALMSVSHLPNLRNLSFQETHTVTVSCWCNFFAKPFVKKVTHLCLENCDNVNDVVGNAIANNMQELRVLSITFCRHMTEKGYLEIQQLIPINCVFHEFDCFLY